MGNRNEQLAQVCRLITARSEENKQSAKLLLENKLYSVAIGILRQEIDSLLRISLLYNESKAHSPARARKMIRDLVNGEQWTRSSKKGKAVRITDREMLNAYRNAMGWEKLVYDFGCQLIHLSNLHDYRHADPVVSLPKNTKSEIILYLTQCHEYEETELNLDSLVQYLPKVIDKICDNTNYFVEAFEKTMSEKLS